MYTFDTKRGEAAPGLIRNLSGKKFRPGRKRQKSSH